MKPLEHKRIGLVLPSVPGYSETFFRSKIKGLQERGAALTVFVGNSNNTKETLPFTIRTAPKLNDSKLWIVCSSLSILVKAFLGNYAVSCRYMQLEKEDGVALTLRLKKLIANHFILKTSLDWLHFGFGTMAIDKENVAQAMGAQMAVSFRGFDIGIYPLKHPHCYEKLFKKVDKIHVISYDITELLSKLGLQRPHLITKITPAIDASFFKTNSNHTTPIPQFLTIGRLHWKKGLEYTLEALAFLHQQGLDFQYTIVGDGPERERLMFAAYQLGLEKKVTFAGKLPKEEVKQHFEKASVYLQYSIQEGFCNAVLEAQAMGLLCVVSDAEGLSENVLNEQTGWVVPKRNPKLLAEKISEIVALDPEQKKHITDIAVKRVKEEFNLEKQIAAFVNFYKE